MLRNYILTAWRNILRNKLYATINIFCLSVGITGAILITLLINQEFSYDKHHVNHQSIYRIEGHYTLGGSTDYFAITAAPLGPALKHEFSGVKNFVRFQHQPDMDIRTEKADFIESSFFFTDSAIFDVFTHRFVYGQPQGALSQPHTVVLTESTSNRFFNETDSRGKIIRINNKPYTITAVIEDVPQNSHLIFDGLISIGSQENAYSLDPDLFWNINLNYTYIQIYESVTIGSILENMDDFHHKYIAPTGDLLGATAKFTATPLEETRFKNILMAPPIASKTSLLILTVVAIFLVIIAAVNYTNLATAQSVLRTREIGVRKVCGATASQVKLQFLVESVLLSLLAMLLSLLLVEILLPGFNTLAGKSFTISNLLQGAMLLQVLLITLATGLLAGAYPAYIISTMNPASILKTGHIKRSGPTYLRKALVVIQFVISIMLVAGTITVKQQLNYLQNKDLGINTDNRLVLFLSDHLSNERIATLENKILQSPLIVSTSKSSSVPAGGYNTIAIQAEAPDRKNEAKITVNVVDEKYLDIYDIKLLEGRAFQKELSTDYGQTAIINETAVKYLGWQGEALGKTIYWQFDPTGTPQKTLRIIGVMKDHNFLSLNNPVSPVMYQLPNEDQRYHYINIQIAPGTAREAIDYIEKTVKTTEPDIIPNIQFTAQGYHDSFSYQKKLGRIFGIFAFVCILISFMGLFGLSSFLSAQRKREVGIRKILGASGWGILGLFYKEFAILIALSVIIAAPLSWYLLDEWLNGFVYHITMTSLPLVQSSALAMAIVFATVSYHTLKAASINPTESLKAE